MRQFGMLLFLASLSALFLATLAAVLITRWQATTWPSDPLQGLRTGLLSATVTLALTSAGLEYARRSIHANKERALKRGLWFAAICVCLFLLLQTRNMLQAWRALDAFDNLFAFSFNLLTGVHALHTLGGLVAVAWVIRRALQREYSSSRAEGVALCAQYWHFLGLVWLVILAVLFAL